MLIAALVSAGLLYSVVCTALGAGIPCPIKSITGLECPGCGVSRMCISLLQLDFASAWKANPAVLLLLPFFLYIAVRLGISYVRCNKKTLSKFDSVLIYSACAVLLLFGILRNII